MSKMRVYELAKELGRDNKEVLDYLSNKGVDVVSHMSMLEDSDVAMVRANVSKVTPKPAPAPAKQQSTASAEGNAEAPKKKNISRVFHGQNSRTGIQKPQSMRNQQQTRPTQGQSRPAFAKPAETVKSADPVKTITKPVKPAEPVKAAESVKTAEPAKTAPVKAAEPAKTAPAKAAEPAKTAPVKAAEPAKTAPVKAAEPAKTAPAKTAEPAKAAPAKQTEGQRPNAQNGERRPFGDRDNRNQNGERRSYGDRDNNRNQNGERRSYGDRDNRNQNGERRSYGDRDNNRAQNGERRPFGDRDNNRAQNGERRSYGDRDNNRNQNGERRSYADRDNNNNRNQNGERKPFGERNNNRNQNGERRPFGDRDNNRNQSGERKPFDRDNNRGFNSDRRGGFSDKDKDSDNNGRDNKGNFRGQNRNASRSTGGSDMASKPVTKESRIRADKEKDKDKYSKHDRFDREEKTQERSGQKNNNGKNDKKAGKFIKPVKPVSTSIEKKEDEIKTITIPEMITIKDLADLLKIQAAAIVKKLFMQGKIVTVNHEVDYDTAEEIAMEHNCIVEHEVKVDVIEELLKDTEDPEDSLVSRPPVVCVMGHVDHGKTSLLDAIRHTHVIAKEAGGITQHIGAYMVNVDGQKITFLDTPGHEAFTAMRMRGANSTDIAILVVAADDGVMPQTIEAISHAKAAGVEVIVAINKIDKPAANIDRVKKELAEHDLLPEDWGGSIVCVPVSAHTKEGLDTLLEMVLLTAEVMELKSNPDRKARGLIIEAQLDKGKGPVATVLVQKGTLHVGDIVAVGACYGKVRAMMDDKGRRVKEATPSTPVEILGLSDVPNAGDIFVVCDSEKEARGFAETFISQNKEKLLEETKAKMSLDDLFTQIQAGNLKELNLIVKADVQGSVEAVKQSLLKLSNDEVVVKVIHAAAGAVNESDVSLASASNAIIIGFNTRTDPGAKATAEQENVDIRLYRVIYDAINDVEHAMKGMLDPIFEEKIIGHAEVRQTFKASGVGTIAGSYIMDGMFQRNCSVRISREGKQIYEGKLASLKRFKDDVKEVKTGYECGLVFEKFNDLQEFDQVEAYIMVEVPR